MRFCPPEDQEGTWVTVDGLYQASTETTTFALHSESGWAAFFDSISIVLADDNPPFVYIGCFQDNEGSRDLLGSGPDGVASNPVEAAPACATACAGFTYFGLQWVNECFCDNSYNNGYGNNGNQAACPGGECPITECDADGVITDGVADLCANGQSNCGQRNAIYSVGAIPEPSEAYCEESAHDYRGTIAITNSGRDCQYWAAQTPHGHSRTANNYPEFGLEGEHNYCRNPDGQPTAWCYTTDPATAWETCDIGSAGLECGPGFLMLDPERGNCDGAVGQFITVAHAGHYNVDGVLDNVISICEFEAMGVPVEVDVIVEVQHPVACGACVPGSYDDDADAATPCIICPAGRYQANFGGTECTVCNMSTNNVTGLVSADQCLFVPLVIGYTSFEEPTVVGGNEQPLYYDTRGGYSDHSLVNNEGENPVVYDACAGGASELGFVTQYINTNDQASVGGLADGDVIGVIGDTSTSMNGDGGLGGAAPHGSQYFAMEDTGGFAYVAVNPVSMLGYLTVRVTGWVNLQELGWGNNDFTKVWVTDVGTDLVPTGREIVLQEGSNPTSGRPVVEPPSGLTNVARAGSTAQSSEGWSGAAARAIDGSTSGSWGSGSCTHTHNGNPEWWQVDLGGFYAIYDFNLYHRTDCCQDRLIGARIMLSATSNYADGIECHTPTDGGNTAQPEVGTCGGAVGQFITVAHSNRYISICEFEAMGEPALAPDMASDSAWHELSADLEGFTVAAVAFGMQSGGTAKAWFDYFQIEAVGVNRSHLLCTRGDCQNGTERAGYVAGSVAGTARCESCISGQVDADLHPGTPCTACPTGTFMATDGQTECTACTPGEYTALPAAKSCQSCAGGNYGNEKWVDQCVVQIAYTSFEEAAMRLVPEPPPPPPGSLALADPCSAGGATLVDFGDLDFTSGYGNDQDCRWTLVCSSGSPTVIFSTFDTEENFDFVNIYDGPADTSTRIDRLHGTTVPASVTATSGGTMLLQFTSDGSGTGGGFHAILSCPGGGGAVACVTAHVGPGPVTDQMISVDPTFSCPTIISSVNWLGGHTTSEIFQLSQYNQGIHVARVDTGDTTAGWTMDLQFECCSSTGGTLAPSPPADPCGASGMILSGSGDLDFDAGHGNGADCRWTLICAAGRPIVTFNSFQTESNFDYVNIYDGSSTDDTRIERLHGSSVPSPVTATSSGVMLVQFTSDGSATRDGFHATMTCEGTTCVAGAAVNLVDFGTLRGLHSNDADCTWALYCSDPAKIARLDFSTFGTETGNDFVYVFDGASADAPLMGEPLHGTVMPRAQLASGPEMFVRLTSDANYRGEGFEADLNCVFPNLSEDVFVPGPSYLPCTQGGAEIGFHTDYTSATISSAAVLDNFQDYSGGAFGVVGYAIHGNGQHAADGTHYLHVPYTNGYFVHGQLDPVDVMAASSIRISAFVNIYSSAGWGGNDRVAVWVTHGMFGQDANATMIETSLVDLDAAGLDTCCSHWARAGGGSSGTGGTGAHNFEYFLSPLSLSPLLHSPHVYESTDVKMCGSSTSAGSPGIFYRLWHGIGGTAVAQMLAHQATLVPPDVEHSNFDLFESPTNVCDNCGTEMDGWFSPAATGPHTFRIAADDNAHLWLGTTEDVALANGEIASVPGWSSSRQWTKYSEQTSAPVDLVAGQLYFIRAVSNEGGGGDNLAVGVTTPAGDLNPIPVVGGDSHVYLHQFDSSVSVALSAADCIATRR